MRRAARSASRCERIRGTAASRVGDIGWMRTIMIGLGLALTACTDASGSIAFEYQLAVGLVPVGELTEPTPAVYIDDFESPDALERSSTLVPS